jgi:hypothetical protein
MATSRADYPNSEHFPSAKSGHVWTKKQILDLIQRADFSERRPAKIRVKVEGKWTVKEGHRYYGRYHMNRFLLSVWKASTAPNGKEIFFFAGVPKYRREAHLSDRQTRYKIKEIRERFRVITDTTKQRADGRSPRTYEFHPQVLQRLRPHRSPKAAPLTPQAVPAAPPVQQPPRHAKNPFAKTLRSGDARRLTECMGRLMLGSPDLAPMLRDKAMAVATGRCSLRIQDVEQYLRDCPWDFQDWKIAKATEAKNGVKGQCARHPESGLTQWGTCWGCYQESYSSDP